MTQQVAKRHHYLPQFYLKGFKIEEENGKEAFIWIYDKTKNQWCKPNTKNAFCEKNLYTLKEDFANQEERIGTVDKAEKLFAEGLEKDFAPLLKRMIENPHVPDKSSEDYRILIGFLALQYVRTPEMIERMNSWNLTNSSEISGLPCVEMAGIRQEVIEQIKNFSWRIEVIEPKSEEVFITSDYPFIEYYEEGFVLLKKRPSRIVGLSFPLSSKLILVGNIESDNEPSVVYASPEDIDSYNKKIYNNARRFIGSSKKETSPFEEPKPSLGRSYQLHY